MNKKIICLATTLLLIFLLGSPLTLGLETANEHTVEITEQENSLAVSESISLTEGSDEYYETLSFWIVSDHTALEILIDGKTPNSKNLVGQNIYECNVSGLEIAKNETINVDINYKLPTNTKEIDINLQYATTSFSTSYKGEEIFTASSLSENSELTIKLAEDTTTTVYKDADATMYLIAIVVLIILLIVVFFFSRKTGQSTDSSKTTESKTASEEYLSTKKSLLMEILKEIEKKHRGKKISDETYHKLKDRYKQEAVEAMKKLEDMK